MRYADSKLEVEGIVAARGRREKKGSPKGILKK